MPNSSTASTAKHHMLDGDHVSMVNVPINKSDITIPRIVVRLWFSRRIPKCESSSLIGIVRTGPSIDRQGHHNAPIHFTRTVHVLCIIRDRSSQKEHREFQDNVGLFGYSHNNYLPLTELVLQELVCIV